MFISKILPYGFSERKFSENFFKEIVVIPKEKMIEQNEVKGLSGEAARTTIKNRLIECLNIATTTEEDFDI